MKKIFQVGDEVIYHRKGEKLRGKVIRIDPDLEFSVICSFHQGGSVESFLPDGRNSGLDPTPSLSFPDGGWDYGTPPAHKPKPLNFDGTPKWAWVGIEPDDLELKMKRLVIAYDGESYLAITSGETNTESTGTDLWDYAWEITDEEAE